MKSLDFAISVLVLSTKLGNLHLCFQPHTVEGCRVEMKGTKGTHFWTHFAL